MNILPDRPAAAVTLFVTLGVLVHVVPLWNTPNPDVVTAYRYWAADPTPEFMAAVPHAWRDVGAVPLHPVRGFFDYWYPATGRFDIGAFVYFWGMARLVGDAPDAWRFVATLCASTALALIYLLARRLGVQSVVAFGLSAALILSPLGWERAIESELRAMLLMAAALYATVVARRPAAHWFAAAAIVGAILNKETFVSAWVVVGALALWRESAGGRLSRSALLRSLLPHAVGALLLGAFVLGVWSWLPARASYAFEAAGQGRLPVAPFLRSFFSNVLPPPLQVPLGQVALPWGMYADSPITIPAAIVAAAGLMAAALAARGGDVRRALADPRTAAVVGGLVGGLLLHATIYYLTNREVRGYYQTPANVYMALLLGVLATPLWRSVAPALTDAAAPSVRRIGTAVAAAVALALAVPGLHQSLRDSGLHRLEMRTWRSLSDRVARETPVGAHVVIWMSSASGGEGAALIQEMLLRRRYDLVFHFGPLPDAACDRAPDACAQYDAFNEGQAALPSPGHGSAPVVDVHVLKTGTPSGVAPLPAAWSDRLRLLVSAPREFLDRAYLGGRMSDLSVQVTRRT
ncbi:MAG: hypothetical protein AB7I25_01330 [Vicinamibacterales bacterium]